MKTIGYSVVVLAVFAAAWGAVNAAGAEVRVPPVNDIKLVPQQQSDGQLASERRRSSERVRVSIDPKFACTSQTTLN